MSEEFIPVPLEVELDALFGAYVEGQLARGLVYGLASREGLVHARGFGVAGEDGRPPDADTVFPIASMSKSFMACAALIARDRGLLALSDPITRYVPELHLLGAGSDHPPTLEMLLSMSGGLTEDNSWVDPFIDLPTAALLERVAAGVRLSRLPGTAYEYSNLGYTLACLAVSRAVGRSLQELVRSEVLEPLGLSSTYFDSALPDGVRRADGYSLDRDARWRPFPHQRSDAFAGAGGLVSTVNDLTRWITWLGRALRDERSDADGVLCAASRRELQRVHVMMAPALCAEPDGSLGVSIGGYGLGLAIDVDLRRGTFISHAGGLPGFHLQMRWHPASGYGVVVLTNSHRGDPALLADRALGRVLARAHEPAETVTLWPQTSALQADAERLLRAWDDALAARILAPNVDFDRPLAERRAEIERLTGEVGPLLPPSERDTTISAATPADVTWSIPARRGKLICTIHLTPVEPAQIQELRVQAVTGDTAGAAALADVAPRRRELGAGAITPLSNTRVRTAAGRAR